MSQLDLSACSNCCPKVVTTCVAKGAGELFEWDFKDVDGNAYPLTDYQFRQQFRKVSDDSIFVTYDTADMTVDDGVVAVALKATDSSGMAVGDAAYKTDLLVTPPAGEPYVPPIQFNINVYLPVSRAS